MTEEKYESRYTHTLPEYDIENPTCISDVKTVSKLRTNTNIEEFDRILGGGIVTGFCSFGWGHTWNRKINSPATNMSKI
jgi:predicted ATP-dependent serine protease